MKTYVIKTYNVNGTYKETINPNSVLNELTFSAGLNEGQGQLSIQTDYAFADTSYKGGEYVKVWLFDENHVNGKQIYYGYISKIQRKAEQSREYTTFTCLGVASLLKNIQYTNGTYSQTCYNMMVNILTFFRNYYTAVSQGTIANTITTTQNWSWSYTNCFDAFKTIADAIGYSFIVDGEGHLDLFIPSSRTEHIVHFGEDVMSITVDNSIEEVVNEYRLARNGGTVQTYQDTTSQTTYGRKMKYESNTSLNSSQTQNDYGNAYIANNKNPKQSLQVVLNAEYAYEDIKPGDRITILNTDLTTLQDLVINKIQYKTDQAVITIDYEDTLWKVIK